LRTGDIDASIGQDPFGQGADPIILAYNQIVTGQADVTGNAFTKMDVVTSENVNEFFPE
jgi:ABC-type sugar transport system substrate-binding protein